MVVKLPDSHDRSYMLCPPLCRCLATTLWLANVASLPQFQDDLHVATSILDRAVALVSQFEFHEEQAFQSHLIRLARADTPWILWHSTSHSRGILVRFSALGYILMLSEFHELSRQQALILERPTLHTLLFGLCHLMVALDVGDVTRNLQYSWDLECIHCKSVGLHSEKPPLDSTQRSWI